MHHDHRPNFARENGNSWSTEMVAQLPLPLPVAPTSPDRLGSQGRTGSALLLQFTQAIAAIIAQQRGDAAVLAVTQSFVQLLQPTALWHASRLPETPVGELPPIQIEDWLEKLKLASGSGVVLPAELSSTARELSQQCIETRQCQLSKVIGVFQVLAVPLMIPGHTPQSLSIAIRADMTNSALPLLTTLVGCLGTLQLDRQIDQGQRGTRQWQSLAKTNSDLESAQNLSQAATHLTTRWAEQLQVQHMAWVVVRHGRATRVAAISGATEIDPASRIYFELIQATQSLLHSDGTIGRFVTGQPAPPKFLQRQSSESPTVHTPTERCLQSIVSELMIPAVVAVPVRSAGQVVAYLFMCGDKTIATPEWEDARRGLLDQIQIQAALATRVHQTAWQRWIDSPTSFVRRWRWWLAAAFLLLGAVAAWPMPYTMYCDCELVTTDRRYAVAPYKGTLKEVFVTPGEVVTPGHLLATMDDRELRIELAGKQAAFEREQNQIRISRAAGDFSKARIAELEAARIDSEIALLNHHLGNREIRSPIAGTIVQGDLTELSGAPVEVGSNLFEVAGLEELMVQIEIPEYQYRYSTIGQEVRLSLEAFPYETFTGVIERFHPRATTREDRNIFVAEIHVPNLAGQLRPGMKGQARILGDAYPLAWKWMHYPYEKTRSLLGWF